MSRKKSFKGRSLSIFLLLMFLPTSIWAADYYVATTGSDTNTGSMGSPWKTITHALENVTVGTINVAAGTYSVPTNGESFPLKMKKNGVSLLGENKTSTILDAGNNARVVSIKKVEGGMLAGFTITNGGADHGAGIKVIDSSITITDNIISQNSAAVGAGIYANGGSALISANQISGNQAGMYGGGLYISDCAGTIERNIIMSNKATKGSGGGIFAADFSGILNNNLIVKNVADSTGGIYAANFDVISQIINNTIADNVGTLFDSVGGMQASVVSGVLKNNIFWNNGADNLFSEEVINISFSIIDDYVGSNNNINGNPLFVNPGANDYHLGAGSPAIDAGTTVGAPTIDLEGNSRPQGGSTDIGAYESEFVAPACTDADGDGYATEGGDCGPIDCNDNNASINPGAAEVCDGVDNNCDGQIDENCVPHDVKLKKIKTEKKIEDCTKTYKVKVEVENKTITPEIAQVVLKKDGLEVSSWTDVNLPPEEKVKLQYIYDPLGDAGNKVQWTAEVTIPYDEDPSNNSAEKETKVKCEDDDDDEGLQMDKHGDKEKGKD